MSRNPYTDHLVGRAGEYAVASQLMLRGEHVFFPAWDCGVDLMTDKGCRVQVKSAHISHTKKIVEKYGESAYCFGVPKFRRISINNNLSRNVKKPPIGDTCDIVVFWGIEQNRFWVAPAKVCEGTSLFILGQQGRHLPRFVGNVKDLREMESLGYKHHEIAEKYGVGRVTITRLLNNPEFEERKPDSSFSVRQCENAWQYITDFGSTASELAVERSECARQETQGEQT